MGGNEQSYFPSQEGSTKKSSLVLKSSTQISCQCHIISIQSRLPGDLENIRRSQTSSQRKYAPSTQSPRIPTICAPSSRMSPNVPNVLLQPGKKYQCPQIPRYFPSQEGSMFMPPVASAIFTHVNPPVPTTVMCNPTNVQKTVKRTACMIGPANHERPPAK